MLQEKKVDPETDSPNVLLYAIILCVHYPLRIWFVIYNLIKVVIVKAVLFPRLLLVYTEHILSLAEELLENKITNLITYLTTIPFNFFEASLAVLLFPFTKSKVTKQKQSKKGNEEKVTSSYLSNLIKRILSGFLNVVHTCKAYLLATFLFPIKISLYCLKLSKSLIYTTLTMTETEPEPEATQKVSRNVPLINYLFDTFLVCKTIVSDYFNSVEINTENIFTQLYDLIKSTPRHLYSALEAIANRCYKAAILTFLVTYHIGEYLILYIMFLFRILTKTRFDYNKEVNNEESTSQEGDVGLDHGDLRQEITKLKDTLNTVKLIENDNYEKQITNIQKQLSETNAKFDKERAQYKQEIEKLQKNQGENNVQRSNNFNSERRKLQDEIQRLQKLIAEVQKENEEENKLKKQEAINLDNERNQLQEQIQNLQHQVVTLQKQNETNALNNEESLKDQEAEFEEERNFFRAQIKEVEDKVAEMEKERAEGNKINTPKSNNVQMNNTDDDKTVRSPRVTSSGKTKKLASNS